MSVFGLHCLLIEDSDVLFGLLSEALWCCSNEHGVAGADEQRDSTD